MVSSLGYHTMELSLRLTRDESLQLLHAFAESRNVFFESNSGKPVYRPQFFSRYYNIKYCQGYKGLSWTLRMSRRSPEYMRQPLLYEVAEEEDRCCTVKARINPKVLLGWDDYLNAADASYLNDLIAVFNQEAKQISPILKDFDSYYLSRIDYCINFDLADLRINCYPEDYMVLIRQANIPNNFIEYKEYRGTTHRKKPGLNSFYLMNNSVHINCYCKYHQLQTEFPSAPYIDNSLNIIRFEIQCLYLKTYFMQRQIKGCDNFQKIMSFMLSDEMCEKIITGYFNKTIGKGDYYSLVAAREKIKTFGFNQNREDRLLTALKLVSTHRGISKAKLNLSEEKLEEFKRSIKDLGELGINPVTIPRQRGIRFLPNLMSAYLAERKREAEMDLWR